MTAVELSSYLALGAVGLFGTNLLLGLLLSVGWIPVRHWPHQPVKLFTFHNWTGYLALAGALLHPLVLLFSSSPPFRLYDIVAPIESPVQPLSNTLGAIGAYLVIIIVATSYWRRAIGHKNWKRIHFATYAAAAIVFVHGVIADPTVTGKAVDYIDGEKVYVEGCAAAFVALGIWRVQHRRAKRRAALRSHQRE